MIKKVFRDQLTAVAAGLTFLTVFSKKAILIYLVVLYCVKVDEYHFVNNQRSSFDRKNEEKVLYNVVFGFLKQKPFPVTNQNVNNANGKRSKFKSSSSGRKGRTILFSYKQRRFNCKRYILKRKKSRKMKLERDLLKIKNFHIFLFIRFFESVFYEIYFKKLTKIRLVATYLKKIHSG